MSGENARRMPPRAVPVAMAAIVGVLYATGSLLGVVMSPLVMMLAEHIAQRTGPFIVAATAFQSYAFSGSDLDIVDVVAVPHRFKQRIGKTERENILDGFFTKIMVYTIDLLFSKFTGQQLIQFMRTLQVMTKWLLYYDAGTMLVGAKLQLTQAGGNIGHQLRRYGQVKYYVRMYAPLFFLLFYKIGDLVVGSRIFRIHLQVRYVTAEIFPVPVLFALATGKFTDPFQQVLMIFFVTVRATA